MPGTGSYVLARLAFYPSLFYNYAMSRVSNRNWYDRIDETVILGALPFRGVAKELVNTENVRAVLSANQPHELKHFTPTDEEWKSLGVDCLRLKILDFLGTPSPTQLDEALNFIEDHRIQGHSVYVHCKAGRTRSATLVACYLIKVIWTVVLIFIVILTMFRLMCPLAFEKKVRKFDKKHLKKAGGYIV